VHDRRINDETYVFGNHGALWRNAMTWYDHATGSVWSQPWGRALEGDLQGTQLQLLPFSLVPWATWLEEHPDTLALATAGNFYSTQSSSDNFVIGIAIAQDAISYPYDIASDAIIINDMLGDIPILVHVNPVNRSIHVFVRQISDGTVLTFTGDEETMIDDQTGSIWDPTRGLATDGDLQSESIREIPYVSSFRNSWLVFYPNSETYAGE